jgi:hypothetical protein
MLRSEHCDLSGRDSRGLGSESRRNVVRNRRDFRVGVSGREARHIGSIAVCAARAIEDHPDHIDSRGIVDGASTRELGCVDDGPRARPGTPIPGASYRSRLRTRGSRAACVAGNNNSSGAVRCRSCSFVFLVLASTERGTLASSWCVASEDEVSSFGGLVTGEARFKLRRVGRRFALFIELSESPPARRSVLP